MNISKITYGSRGTATPINEVEFLYASKDRDELSFINGTSFKRTQRLTDIKIKGNSTVYRNYDLRYNRSSLDYDRLDKFMNTQVITVYIETLLVLPMENRFP